MTEAGLADIEASCRAPREGDRTLPPRLRYGVRRASAEVVKTSDDNKASLIPLSHCVGTTPARRGFGSWAKMRPTQLAARLSPVSSPPMAREKAVLTDGPDVG